MTKGKVLIFGDLHFSCVYQGQHKNYIYDCYSNMNLITEVVKKEKPAWIIFLGDIIGVNERNIRDHQFLMRVILFFETLNSITNGNVYTVKGNHDYDHDYFDKITEKLNWKVLNNTYEFIYKDSTTPLVFVGFDDLLRGKVDINNGFSYKNENPDDLFTIVLTHEPDLIDQITDDNYNVAFAGHSHLGQVRIPLIGALWTPEGSKKYKDEHYIIDDKELYVSGGIGTSSLKLRFFNKPSITLYRLRTK